MIAGQWKVMDGKIIGKDESELINRHSSAAKKLRQLANA
jgi:8-oxoguanine deaminase